MSVAAPAGWGGGRWGASPWGGGTTEDLQLLAVSSVRENAIQLTFSEAPFLDGLLSPNDASDPRRYAITPVPGGIGLDGLPVRPVIPLFAEASNAALTFGAQLILWLDRPMSPFPTQYVVAVNNLLTSATQLPLDPAFTSGQVFGLQRVRIPNDPTTVLPNRDFANPQTRSSGAGQLSIYSAAGLGAFAVDATGDYAIDDGLDNLKKRVLRRLLTRPGAFAYAPGYGVGVQLYSKQLGRASVRQKLAAEAERQIRLEPDVVAVQVTSAQRAPGLVVFTVLVQTITGLSARIDAPFPIG